jgi:hypothetical protein
MYVKKDIVQLTWLFLCSGPASFTILEEGSASVYNKIAFHILGPHHKSNPFILPLLLSI